MCAKAAATSARSADGETTSGVISESASAVGAWARAISFMRSRWSRNSAFRKTPQICAIGGSVGSGPTAPCGSLVDSSAFCSAAAAALQRTPIANTRVAPRRIAGESGATNRSAPSPKKHSPPGEVRMRTGGKTIGIAADALTCSWVISVESATRRARAHTGCPGRPCTNVKERPE